MRNIERTDTSRCRRALKAVLKAIWKAADIVLLTAGILSYVIIFAFPDIKVYVYDIAGVLSLVYCSIYLIKWLCRPIWRDWMLVNGHFLIKVVIFVLFTPLAINMCFRLWEGKYGAYSPVNLLVAADTAERLPDSRWYPCNSGKSQRPQAPRKEILRPGKKRPVSGILFPGRTEAPDTERRQRQGGQAHCWKTWCSPHVSGKAG